MLLVSFLAAGPSSAQSPTPPPKRTFALKEATTLAADGKQLKARPGFELVKSGQNVTARRLSKPTEGSSDRYVCTCTATKAGLSACFTSVDDERGGYLCGGDCSCKFVLSN